MPYLFRIIGLRVDLRHLEEAARHCVHKRLEQIEEEDADLGYLERTLTELASSYPNLVVHLAAKGEEGDYHVLRVRDGVYSRTEGRDQSIEPRRVILEPPQKDGLAARIKEVRALAKKRAAAPADRLLQVLRTEGQGESDIARDLRREIYAALSWIETDEIARVLLDALEREPEALASSVGYVLWRQEAIMVDLPRLIDEAIAAGNEVLAGRLLAALVRGDDDRRQREWVLAHHAALLRRIGLAYD